MGLYKALVQQGGNHDKKAYQALLTRMKFMTPGLDAKIDDRMVAVFILDRTRYGLIRLFEKMGSKLISKINMNIAKGG